MSRIITYFVAPDDAAAAAAQDPESSFESATFGNFDAVTALTSWEAILTGQDFDDLLDEGNPRLVDTRGDAQLLVAASPALQAALAGADGPALAELGRQWEEQEAEEYGDDIEPGALGQIVGEVAALCRSAQQAGQTVYCWIV